MFLVPPSALAGSTVSGVVTDSTGTEVAQAFVEALPMARGEQGGTVGDRPNPWVPTDSHGKFRISLAPGRYRIRAKAEADGFPDPVFMLNRDPTARFPEISVERQDVSDVRVILGKRGGVLDGVLLDQDSRKPIPHGKVTISDARAVEAYVEVFADEQGHFEFAVPNKPVRVSATAAGHATAYVDNGKELTLSGGEHRTVELELKPEL
jgi:hypothetical protein